VGTNVRLERVGLCVGIERVGKLIGIFVRPPDVGDGVISTFFGVIEGYKLSYLEIKPVGMPLQGFDKGSVSLDVGSLLFKFKSKLLGIKDGLSIEYSPKGLLYLEGKSDGI